MNETFDACAMIALLRLEPGALLARRLGGEVVTTDHHEFDPLVPLGICPIRFLR